MRISRLLIVSGVVVLATLGGAAVAYWVTDAQGTAQGSAGSLTAPGKPTTSASTSGIALSWSASAVSGGGNVRYHVERRLSAGSSWGDACGSSAGSPIGATSCTDSPGGTSALVYRITAVFRTWSALGVESDPVTAVEAPTVSSVSSTLGNGSYKAGQVVPVTIAFTSAVTVTGSPQLLLETGSIDRNATYASGSGTSTLTFSYIVQAGDTSSDLDYAASNSLGLNGGTIRDASSTDADRTLPSPGAGGSLGANRAIVIDTTAPTVSSVSSTLPNGSYKSAQAVPITVTFSEPVAVTGTPQLLLETGSIDRSATYASGSGTSVLTFSYTVQPGDTSADLNYHSTSALTLTGGSAIRDAATNDSTLTLAPLAAANSLAGGKDIVIDTTAPAVTSVSSTLPNGSYKAGVTIPVTISFSEAVNVTGSPQLLLNLSPTDRNATYAGGSGTNTLTFNYVVQAGDSANDLNYVSTSSLTSNGGAITDAAVNNAALTLPSTSSGSSLGVNKNIVIDTTSPSVSSVDSPTSSGSYGVGSTISIRIDFSQSVTVSGTPQLTLETGATDRAINYTSGSGSSSLIFSYTVQAGDTSSDLDYVSATSLSLNGGSIRDAASNDATLTLPNPGANNSLSDNESFVIDTTAPALQSLQFFDSDTDGRIDQLRATFNETLVSTGNTSTPWSFSGTVPGNGTKGTVSTSGSVATLAINEGGSDTAPSASWQVSLSAAANGVRDAVGNQATFGGLTPADKAGPVPTALVDTNGATDGKFEAGDTMTVTFSENVVGVASSSNVSLVGVGGGDTAAMPGFLAAATSLGANDYISGNGTTANFNNSALTRPNANEVRVSLGSCTGTGTACTTSLTTGSAGTFVFAPAATITDAAANAAAGSISKSSFRVF